MPEPLRLKLLVTGPHRAGKSCLIKNYCEGKHVARYLPTIGIDYGVRTVEIAGTPVKVNFFDASGDESFREIAEEFCAGAQALVVVADASSPEALQEAAAFAAAAARRAECPLRYLVLSKTDVAQRHSDAQVADFARQQGLRWFKCSSLTGENVQQLFASIFKDMYNLYAPQ